MRSAELGSGPLFGVTTAVLDPVEGLTDETADSDYLSLMEDNLEALRSAGGC